MAIEFADPINQYGTQADLTDFITSWWTQLYVAAAGDAPSTGDYFSGTFTKGIQFTTGSGDLGQALGVTLPSTVTKTIGFRWVQNGGGFADLGNYSSYLEDSLFDPQNPIIGFTTPINVLVYFRYGGSTHVGFSIEANGKIAAIVCDTSDQDISVVGYTDFALQQEQEYYIEIQVVIGTPGSIKIWVNGDVWMDLPSVTTQYNHVPTAALVDEILIGRIAPGGGQLNVPANITWSYRDIYILNDDVSDTNNDQVDPFGPITIHWTQPTADGAMTDWTPSTGTDHFAMVDEIPKDDDTTLNEADTAGQIDTFTTGGVPIVGVDPVAVGVMFAAKRTTAGPSSTQPVLRIGASNYAIGDPRGNTQTYTYQGGFTNKKPSDSSAWTAAAFNSCEPGYKKVS